MVSQLRKQYGCPVELALEFVGGKWQTVILARLKEAPHRYGELRARLPNVADKVLTQRLKDLEALGLVAKEPINGQRGAHLYRLTERGESLRPVLDALYVWGSARAEELAIRVGPTRSAQLASEGRENAAPPAIT